MEAVAPSPSPLASQSPGASGETPSAFITVDPKLVVDYLVSVVSITLGATREDLESPGSLLSKTSYADTLQRCTRFASDAQVALYIQKETTPSADLPDATVDTGKPLNTLLPSSPPSRLPRAQTANQSHRTSRKLHLYHNPRDHLFACHNSLPRASQASPGDRSFAALVDPGADSDATRCWIPE